MVINVQVAEKFISIDGEGPHAGELAAFIRFKGCNLNCTYCDTKWANVKNCTAAEESAEDLVRWVRDEGIDNVTLTGGEPLLQKDIQHLISALLDQGCRVEIETNGSIDLAPFCEDPKHRPVFTVDCKLMSSGAACVRAMRPENYRLLNGHDSVKFVCGSLEDLKRAQAIIAKYDLDQICHVFLSPVFGEISPKTIVAFMKDKRLNGVRLQLQLHKMIWNPAARGV
jgi:7-carboxy-7-deazaguanine synthase